MDHTILRKKLGTFKSSKGSLTGLSDELVMEVLRVWESWTGSTKDLCQELGMKPTQMGFIVRKAKKLVKSGSFVESDFKELGNMAVGAELGESSRECPEGIVMKWGEGKVIEFPMVEQLVEFLKKVS